PIVFVGQDFAFAGGRTHAEGATFDAAVDESTPQQDLLTVPGVDGAPVLTRRAYYDYLLLMQDYLLDLAIKRPHVRHINTSQTGARVQVMEELPLQQVLAAQSAGAQIPRALVRSLLDQRHPHRPKPRHAHVDRWLCGL